MVTVKIEQYLASVLDSTKSDTNEVKLQAGNHDLDLCTIFLENHNTGIHRYQTSEITILYEASGKSKIRVNGQDMVIDAGNIVLLLSKSSYEVFKQDKNDILVKLEYNAHLDCRYFLGENSLLNNLEKETVENITDTLKTRRLLYLKCTLMSKSAHLMRGIIDEYLNQSLFTRATILAELKLLFISAIRNQELVELPVISHEFAQTTLESYIDANFTDITLNETAKHFGFNPNYFSSLVKQKTGKSFVEHVDERRMEEARSLLARPDISVREIIDRVGYSGKSFFYKKFNEYYHETPVQMRAELFRQANINLK